MPEDLRQILTHADKIVVKTSPTKGSTILFESTDKKDLDDLWESLALIPPAEWFHCMCIGTPAIYVYERGPPTCRDNKSPRSIDSLLVVG